MEGLIMFEGYSRAIHAARTADAAADTHSDFVARERRWMAEAQVLQSTWSFIERRNTTIAKSSLAFKYVLGSSDLTFAALPLESRRMKVVPVNRHGALSRCAIVPTG
jgi:hypothetical protein